MKYKGSQVDGAVNYQLMILLGECTTDYNTNIII